MDCSFRGVNFFLCRERALRCAQERAAAVVGDKEVGAPLQSVGGGRRGGRVGGGRTRGDSRRPPASAQGGQLGSSTRLGRYLGRHLGRQDQATAIPPPIYLDWTHSQHINDASELDQTQLTPNRTKPQHTLCRL